MVFVYLYIGTFHYFLQNSIKNFLIQDFFYTDNTRQKYDFNKVVLFNLLYSGGKDLEKANFLYNMIENT